MKHFITLTIALPLLALAPACDSPDDEAELAALDIEDDDDEGQGQGQDEDDAEEDRPDLDRTAKPSAPVADYVDAINQWGQHVPCGLTYFYSPNGNGGPGLWVQSVGNCHTYSVSRKIIYNTGSPGMCRNFSQHEAYTLSTERKPIDLVGC